MRPRRNLGARELENFRVTVAKARTISIALLVSLVIRKTELLPEAPKND